VLQRPVGLGARALHEVVLAGLVSLARGELVEEQAEGVQRVVQLVQHRGDEHPHGLVALDPVESHPQRVGARGGFLCGRELRAKPQVVCADAEQRPDHDRKDAVDDRVGVLQRAGQRPGADARLGEDIEDDVDDARADAERHVRDEARFLRSSRCAHPCAVYPGGRRRSYARRRPRPLHA